MISGSAAYAVDENQKTVNHPERGVSRVSPQQFRLLSFLHAHSGRIFSARELLENVWREPPDSAASDDVVRMTVMGLRRKLGKDVVDTVPFYGYGVGISP